MKQITGWAETPALQRRSLSAEGNGPFPSTRPTYSSFVTQPGGWREVIQINERWGCEGKEEEEEEEDEEEEEEADMITH
ncbi:unnamed protein product [Pleuronectes platessa]|uniref:Uncharacterized protein n=1 Tax=Pleuronectes platessa TaxID=8262 RepID=A0A9N7Z3F4_PLEPL|nr:unnamed protein product [Pleuronectes platessa]